MRARQSADWGEVVEEMIGTAAPARAPVWDAVRALVGLAVLVVSADRLVWGASRIAEQLGVPEAVIGLTIVAVGTSLPEVVTATVAARRDEPDIVLGNVLGSNLFNALLIIGVTALVAPLPFAERSKPVALAAAVGSALLLVLFLIRGYRVTRAHVVAGLFLYAAFVATLYLAS